MAVNVKSAIQDIYREWNSTLLAAMQGMPPSVRGDYVVEVPSAGKYTVHSWFLNQARVRRWTGQRQFNNLSTASWTVHNDEEYELSFEFESREIEDDLSGLVGNAVNAARNTAGKWAQHQDLLCAQALEAGLTSTCWDGQNFFDDSHPYDPDSIGTSGTFDNKHSLALTTANIETLLTVFRSMLDPSGMPVVSSSPIVLMVPEALRWKAIQATTDATVAMSAARGLFSADQPTPSLMTQAVRVVVNPYLNLDGANPNRWYLVRMDGAVKPILFQRRSSLETFEQGTDSEVYFVERKIRFGGNARHKASYTLPQLAITSSP
jgi:phage major head subunit gpT-like protein